MGEQWWGLTWGVDQGNIKKQGVVWARFAGLGVFVWVGFVLG